MKYRNPAIVLILLLVTLGIYGIYWLYATRKEITAKLDDKDAIWPVTVLFIPLFIFLAGILIFVAAIMAGSTFATITGFIVSFISVLGFLAGIVIAFIWFYYYCQALEKLTKTASPGVLYILWVVLTVVGFSIVWFVLAQVELNKLTDSTKV